MTTLQGLRPRTADDIRSDIKKIAAAYSVTMEQVLPIMIEAGDLEKAAADPYDAQVFIDAVQKGILELSKAPKLTFDEARKKLVGKKEKRVLGRNPYAQTPENNRRLKAYEELAKRGFSGEHVLIVNTATERAGDDDESFWAELCAWMYANPQKGYKHTTVTKTTCYMGKFGKSYKFFHPNGDFAFDMAANSPDLYTQLTAAAPEIKDLQPGQDMPIHLRIDYKMISNRAQGQLVPTMFRIDKAEESSVSEIPLFDTLEVPEKTTTPDGIVVTKPSPKLAIEGAQDADIIEEFAAATEKLEAVVNPAPKNEWGNDEGKVAVLLDSLINLARDAQVAPADVKSRALQSLGVASFDQFDGKGSDAFIKIRDDWKTVNSTPDQPLPSTPVAETDNRLTVANSEPQPGQSVVNYQTPQIPRSLQIMATPAGKALLDLAKSVAASKLYPNVDTIDKAIVIMWKGVELGIEPFAALEGIYVIMGKPSLSANLMLSLANSSGLIRDIRIVGNETYCEVTMWRKDRDTPHTERFTTDDARQAGLYDKNQSLWPKYPKSMCKARAISNCFKAVCPELAMGIRSVADDIEDDDDAMARDLIAA